MSHDALLRGIDVCQRLGISDETWRRWRARGEAPPPVKTPGRPRWRSSDIEAFLARGPRPAGRRSYFTSHR